MARTHVLQARPLEPLVRCKAPDFSAFYPFESAVLGGLCGTLILGAIVKQLMSKGTVKTLLAENLRIGCGFSIEEL